MAARQWTDEQRKAQAERIKTYQPWLQSTGATSEEGKKKVSQNALKTGEYTADKVAERKRKAKVKKAGAAPMVISVLDGIGQLIILVLLKQSKKLKGRKPKSE